jgi:hypothetical protein
MISITYNLGTGQFILIHDIRIFRTFLIWVILLLRRRHIYLFIFITILNLDNLGGLMIRIVNTLNTFFLYIFILFLAERFNNIFYLNWGTNKRLFFINFFFFLCFTINFNYWLLVLCIKHCFFIVMFILWY